MSMLCPNARKVHALRARRHFDEYKCDVLCVLCNGSAVVDDCPDCDGCGLRVGGVRCETCRCQGKVPAKKTV
jgi:RecJ-like exonuclease